MAFQLTSCTVVALCICLTILQTASASEIQAGRRVARDLNLNSVISGLATQFFSNGGHKGVSELSASDNKPNILQKYLGGALISNLLGGGGNTGGSGSGGALLSSILSGGGKTGGSGGGESGFNMNHPLVRQLIQMIMTKFGGGANSGAGGILGGGAATGAGTSAPQANAMTLLDGNVQVQQPKEKSGGAGAAIMKVIAKQLMKA